MGDNTDSSGIIDDSNQEPADTTSGEITQDISLHLTEYKQKTKVEYIDLSGLSNTSIHTIGYQKVIHGKRTN